jgi:hypothetical protein
MQPVKLLLDSGHQVTFATPTGEGTTVDVNSIDAGPLVRVHGGAGFWRRGASGVSIRHARACVAWLTMRQQVRARPRS